MREVVRRIESRAGSGERQGAPSQAQERQCTERSICKLDSVGLLGLRVHRKTFIHTFNNPHITNRLVFFPGSIPFL